MQYPFIGIVDLSVGEQNMGKYLPNGHKIGDTIMPEVITTFVKDFRDDQLNSILKTEADPVSPAPSDLPVVALNTITFKSIFNDNPDKDIFIFFAGPACFNCKEVWPVFEKVVRVLHEGSHGMLFAYVDISYNEL